VLPVILEISDWATKTSYERPRKDHVWPMFIRSEHPQGAGDASLTGLRDALAAVARNASVDLADICARLRSRDTYVANLLLMTLYESGGDRFADEAAAALVQEPWRFRCGWSDSEYWVARQTVSSIVQFCSIENAKDSKQPSCSSRPILKSRASGSERVVTHDSICSPLSQRS